MIWGRHNKKVTTGAMRNLHRYNLEDVNMNMWPLEWYKDYKNG